MIEFIYVYVAGLLAGVYLGWYWTQNYWFKELRESDKKLQKDFKAMLDDIDLHISLCHKDDKNE